MTFDAFDSVVWQLAFIFVGGWLATDIWRWSGVLLGNRLQDESDLLVFVRCIATGLVAAVIAQLIVYPSGALGRETEAGLRIAAALIGFVAYLSCGKKVAVGVGISLLVLSLGIYLNI